MTRPAPKVELRDLAKSFGAKPVLNGIDLQLAAGESLVIIGGSGSGKSVTLKCILGLLTPDRGTILLDGTEVTHLRGPARQTANRHFGMLFQGAALFDSLPIWENVAFALLYGAPSRGGGVPRAQARRIALSRLHQVGLDELVADQYPAELSGGMQKRAALARAIATDPDILLFDEPTTGLDPIRAARIDALISDVTRQQGAAAITITHDLASARRIADRVALLHDGMILWSGRPEEMDRAENPHLRQFIRGDAHGPMTGDPPAA